MDFLNSLEISKDVLDIYKDYFHKESIYKEDMKYLSLIDSLYQIGLPVKQIHHYLDLYLLDNKHDLIDILNNYRKNKLNDIHHLEKDIEIIDYLKHVLIHAG